MDKRKPTASREEPKVSMPPAPEHGTALPAGDGGVASQAGETAIDLRGLKCPLPALRTRKALSRLPAGAHTDGGNAPIPWPKSTSPT